MSGQLHLYQATSLLFTFHPQQITPSPLPLRVFPSVNLCFLLFVIFDLLSALAPGLISRNDTQILFHPGSPRLKWPINLIFPFPGGL